MYEGFACELAARDTSLGLVKAAGSLTASSLAILIPTAVHIGVLGDYDRTRTVYLRLVIEQPRKTLLYF